MKTPRALLPSLPTLRAGLTAALANGSPAAGPVKVLARELPRFMSTFPNEIVTCQLANGRKRRMFIKYAGDRSHGSFGHRGDVAYEAQVYQRLLRPMPDFRPRCLGTHTDPQTSDTWIILEYVDGSVRISDLSFRRATRQPRALAEAAYWLGRFHARQEARVSDPALSFLKCYDAEYYGAWAWRMFEFSQPLRKDFPWLARLQRSGDRWFAPLLDSPPTVIHGEFYPKTVLVRRGNLFMVDWESAAIGPGEVDLAALTEGKHWRGDVARQCQCSYRESRWPEGAPRQFQARLNAARIYLHFRWLGERPDWATREKTLWRYEHLRTTAKRLGLI